MEKYKGHATVVVGDVDCTAAGKPLCEANGVQGCVAALLIARGATGLVRGKPQS